MILPVTHFLYAGMALSSFGVAVMLGSSSAGRRTLAVHCMFGGVALVCVAFARFWGSNQGQAMALLVMVMAMASSVMRPVYSSDRPSTESPVGGDS